MAKIFFTSGTGYIGFAAAKAAKDAGHEVTAIARSDESASKLAKYGIKIQLGDVRRPETYRDVLTQYDVVVHTAAVEGADFPKIEDEIINTVIEALRGTQKAFIYTSGVWVLGNTGDKPATEDSATNPIPLVAWRPALERRVLDAAEYGIRSVVIRPAIVYGHGGGILGQLYSYAKTNGYVPYIGNGDNRWSLVHVEDVARLYVLAAEKAPARAVLHASDNKPLAQRQVAVLVAHSAGVNGKVQTVAVEEARKIFGVYADGLVLDQAVEAPVARRVLNWHPSAPSLADELSKKVQELVGARK